MKRSLHAASLALILTIAVSACAQTTPPPTTTTAPPTTSTTAAPTTTKPAVTTPSGQAPKYGGTLNLALTADITTWDDQNQGGPSGIWTELVAQTLWQGDWTKGNAGGYGTKVTDWGINGYDAFDQKAGFLAESWKVNIDPDKGAASVVYKIRQGVHFALDPNNPLSKQVNGREVTVTDLLESIDHGVNNNVDYLYRSNPELRKIDIKQTAPWDFTSNCPISVVVTAMSRIGNMQRLYPPELRGKGVDWHALVGTGPYMISNYVSGSAISYVKNPNYWMTDPIGPGKGNKLPYLDGVNLAILPDASTRMAAFRTGKIDQIERLTWEDTAQLKKEFPQMAVADLGDWTSTGGACIYMRTDKAPYSDVRIRRALMMATDFNSIKKDFNGGNGEIIGFPFVKYPGYEALYAGINDPDLTPAIKEQFTYSPDKAKGLLAQAGFPNGFTTSIMTDAASSSYMEMLAGMWAKSGITLNIKVMDRPAITNTLNAQGLTDLTMSTGFASTAIYYTGNVFSGVPGASTNLSYVNDPEVEQTLPKIRTLAATDPGKSMVLAKQLMLRALDQAWVIQVPKYRSSTFWQPWLKNYSGEISVGYYSIGAWASFAWIDPSLKK